MKRLPHRIRKEPSLLLTKSLNSLVLSMELFNRPWDVGRSDGVLILLDHSLEMVLKAGILHKGGRIKEPKEHNTIGFDACVKRALSNAECKFLCEDDALVLNTINALRDAAQHHISDIAEEQLYLHMQSGLTLYRDMMANVFSMDIADYLPHRVLPVSTVAFSSIESFFDHQIEEVRKLLAPGRRRRQEARSSLRPLAIMDRALQGDAGQPSERELDRIADRIKKGDDWRVVFLGVNLVECISNGDGPTISLRISKKEGIPMRIVRTEEEAGGIIGLKRVNELDYYSLMPTQMAKHLNITPPKFYALSRYLRLEEDEDYFKLINMGKQVHKRYSKKALDRSRTEIEKLSSCDWECIWAAHRPGNKARTS